jgi:hypothetical protein
MTTTRDQEEQDVGIDQMTVNIEKMRADMRSENRRFLWQAIAAIGTAFAGGAAALGLLLHMLGKL